MKKLLQHKFWIIALLVIVVGINLLANFWFKRIDLTEEKRYSLSKSSKELLKNLKEPVNINVFLKGQFPAGFRRLSNATRSFLEECTYYANGKLTVQFTNPLQNLEGEDVEIFKDSMQIFYDIPSIDINSLQKENNETSTISDVLPGAIVSSGDRVFGVNLLRRGILNLEDEEKTAALFSKVEATLENKFIDAIVKASNLEVKKVGYAIGNGQPVEEDGIALDLINTLAPKSETSAAYQFGYVDVKLVPFIPDEIEALIIAKPTQPFTDLDKLKIDQFVMRGGNVFWMVDNMYAEFDSLMRSGPQGFVAFDRGLNIDDLLFKYGVRINQNLLQDLNCDILPLVKGGTEGTMQTQRIKFSFLPILNGTNHPIVKNMDGVRGVFPNTLDTISGNNIKKTILLQSSNHARIIGTPYNVDFSFMQYADDKSKFTVKDTAVAALLEGNFTSFFANRLSSALTDTLKKYNRTFLDKAIKPGKMVVVADGDIALNFISEKGEPLLMGQNNFTHITYANKDFFLNCIEYLTGNEKILDTRNKDFTVRLLDPIKKENKAGMWKLLTTVVPITILLLFGVLHGFLRKRKYQK